jgi:signal transduction histidine kinase
LRRRLVVAIAGVAAASVVLFALPLGLVLRGQYRDREALRLQRDTVAATRGIDLGGGADRVELPASRDTLAVYDRTGRRVAGHGPARADAAVRRVLRTGRPTDAKAPGALVAAVPLVVAEQVSGAVRAARSDEDVERSANRAWALIGALVAALLVAAAAAAAVLARRLARPLEELAAAAGSLGDRRGPTSESFAVAEVDALATALNEAGDRVDATLARERAFSADASHQLRTPLAALRLELEALELRGHRSHEVTAALREVERLQATVETLLALARDAPRAEGEVDAHELIDEVGSTWRPRLAAVARPLHIRSGGGRLVLRSSPNVAREVLDVLLANTFEHGAGTVTVTLRGGGDWAHIDVSDEGPGVGDAAEALFERRVGSGRGIGLALARSLARAEGGQLVASAATFTLTLPTVVRIDR